VGGASARLDVRLIAIEALQDLGVVPILELQFGEVVICSSAVFFPSSQ